MRFIVGLGNPGSRYEKTRHNVGFMLIDRIARVYGIRCDRRGMRAAWGKGAIEGEDVILIKPQTFMNLSGESVLEFRTAFPEVELNSIIVAFDDCDLPLGRLRIRKSGSSGGHRGIASIIRCLGNPDFPRIRLGVGRPEGAGAGGTGGGGGSIRTAGDAEEGLVDYVLSPFSVDELHTVDDMLTRAAASVEAIIREGIEAAMNRYNPAC